MNGDRAAGLQDAVNFLRGGFGIGQMFEDFESEDAIENAVTERKMVSVAHDISVPKNLMLELDAIRIALRRSARANVQDEIISSSQNGFVFRSDWIAGVVRRNQLEGFGQKNGDAIIERKGAEAVLAI